MMMMMMMMIDEFNEDASNVQDEDEDELKKANQQQQQEQPQQPSAEKPNEQAATKNVIDPYTHEIESIEQEKEEQNTESTSEVVNIVDPYTHETESAQSAITVNLVNTNNVFKNAQEKAENKKIVSVSIVPGIDVELHNGIDGRMYMLDLARFCPSHPHSHDMEDPLFTKERQCYLFRQFRAEFMRRYCREFLSSDAFSPFGIVSVVSFLFCFYLLLLFIINSSNFEVHSIETISWNQNKESSRREYRI